MQGDAAIGGRYIVIGLPEHGIEAVQRHVLAEKSVCEPVNLQQPLQLLPRRETMAVRPAGNRLCLSLSLVISLTDSLHAGGTTY